jgi:hypothetical protein
MGHDLASLRVHFESGQAKGGEAASRRARRRRIPDMDSLENRMCLSTMTPAIAARHGQHAEVTAHHATPRHRGPLAVHHGSQHVSPFKKPKLLQTIYVRPGGRVGPNAGKSPNRPLGNLNKAIKLIKPGGTIILAPGVYRQNVVVSQKSNVTIIGAANQSSIIAPAGGDGVKVALSNNITIANVWLRAPQGRGMTIMGASVNVTNIRTDGTHGDGVAVARYRGQGASLNAYSSQFNAVQTGSGLALQGGSSAVINGCTFNGDGTAANVTQASNGLVLTGDAVANIVNSQFIGNTNSGMVALDNSRVTVQASNFSSNVKGNGALFIGSSTADLRSNYFASNGVTRGATTGLNGLEFINGFAGAAFVSGNSFVNNTAMGIYVGGGPNTLQIVSNLFDNNVIGLSMDTATGTTINAIVQGNTIRSPVDRSQTNAGILAIGRGLTATIGGDGSLGNTIQNYSPGLFIYEGDGDGNAHNAGYPRLTILTNSYTSNGVAVSPSEAIHHG